MSNILKHPCSIFSVMYDKVLYFVVGTFQLFIMLSCTIETFRFSKVPVVTSHLGINLLSSRLGFQIIVSNFRMSRIRTNNSTRVGRGTILTEFSNSFWKCSSFSNKSSTLFFTMFQNVRKCELTWGWISYVKCTNNVFRLKTQRKYVVRETCEISLLDAINFESSPLKCCSRLSFFVSLESLEAKQNNHWPWWIQHPHLSSLAAEKLIGNL